LTGGGQGGAEGPRVEAALAIAQDLVRRAQSADPTVRLPALEALPQALNDLLAAAQAAFGAGPGYSSIRAWVLSVLSSILGDLPGLSSVGGQASGAGSTGTQVDDERDRFFATAGRFGIQSGPRLHDSLLEALRNEIHGLRDDVREVEVAVVAGNVQRGKVIDTEIERLDEERRLRLGQDLLSPMPKQRAKKG
jgi:hypothetical protein